MSVVRLTDRQEAGRLLAAKLSAYRSRPNTLVLGLPRGGVAVAAPLARSLELPLDVCNVRKLALPSYPELAVGAIAPGGLVVWNQDVIDACQFSREELSAVARRERAEVDRREQVFRAGRPPLDLAHKTVILCDDGIATGATIRAAIQMARFHEAAHVVVAIGAAPQTAMHWLRREADEVAAIVTPEPFSAVGVWFEDFAQLTDHDVLQLLSSFPSAA